MRKISNLIRILLYKINMGRLYIRTWHVYSPWETFNGHYHFLFQCFTVHYVTSTKIWIISYPVVTNILLWLWNKKFLAANCGSLRHIWWKFRLISTDKCNVSNLAYFIILWCLFNESILNYCYNFEKNITKISIFTSTVNFLPHSNYGKWHVKLCSRS